MKVNDGGIALIREFEGCRTKAYRDPVGIWTIGFGHTAAAGEPKPVSGMVITEAEAEAILRRDLGKYESAVLLAVDRTPNANEFAAMVSLCFNVGPAAFRGSSVCRHFNAGDTVRAADSFRLWNKAGGRVLTGLVRRREAERTLFLKPVTDAPREPVEPFPPPPDVEPTPEPETVPTGFWRWLLSLFQR